MGDFLPMKDRMQGNISLGEKTQSQRDSNLELYRVIVMLLIIAHHYVVNSGLMGMMREHPTTANAIFLWLFGAWGKTGINCFVLITGFFMCKSHISLKKFMKLLLEVTFYKVVIYCVFAMTGYTEFSKRAFLKLFLPVTQIQDNFTGCYLMFFLLIPFLNILIHAMTQKQHLLLIALCLLMYTGVGTVPGFGVTMNYVSWFAVLYMIASYIRLYPVALFNNVRIWGVLALLTFLLSAASIIVLIATGKSGLAHFFVSDSNKVLAVATGVSSFLFFKNLKIKHSKIINLLGGSTFGVLLIHANSDTMRQWLWVDLLRNTEMFDSAWLPVHALVSVFAIFGICSVFDIVRIHLIEKPFFRLWDKYQNHFLVWYKMKEEKVLEMLNIKE